MSERCVGLFGNHKLKVCRTGAWMDAPYILCTRCQRHWWLNLDQSVPYGADSWKEWKEEAERIDKTLKRREHPDDKPYLWYPSVNLRKLGETLEPELAAPVVAEYLINQAHPSMSADQAAAYRALAKTKPRTFMARVNGQEVDYGEEG